jgi:hypothetical protein
MPAVYTFCDFTFIVNYTGGEFNEFLGALNSYCCDVQAER